MNNNFIGKVILAAAGPGDPDLITVKAVRWLEQAHVVLVDRLVSEAILHRYVNSRAEIIHVGKQSGRSGSTPQPTINRLMIEHARAGRLVVRLKGGDASVFSNIFDELSALVNNRIPYEIVPGVTAALGAAAYAGIPLTAREYASGIRLLTFYKSDVIQDKYWEELAQTDDTLVFYMSGEMLDQAAALLLGKGISQDKGIAVIEQASTPMQQVTISSFAEYDRKLKGRTFQSPALVIVGKVAFLHERFRWFKNSNSGELYFKPIHAFVLSAEPSVSE
ncbi:MAG: uroporphyrinogen-III C-methyltransferase [Williamsia sp.]|nr:uroporphyrinogen-III C-methyltransferase [Williamsia sp.]